MSLQIMSAASVHERQRQGQRVDLIDVRTPAEFREIHADGAKLFPLDKFDPAAVAGELQGNSAYVLCRSGGRAKQACEKLMAAGYENVVLIEGGTLAWEQAGLPVQRGKKTISLERQVRIVAGALVLTFTLLGYFVHPYFLGIPVFIGAGLLFAGITDTCGMGMMLAKMPWNQVGAAAAEAPQCARP